MPTYTTGETKRAYIVAEVTYGTTPTSALSYIGLMKSLRPSVNFKVEKHKIPATRGHSTHTRGPYDIGFNYVGKAHVVSGTYHWYDFFALYGYGATGGIEDGSTTYGRLGSFSLIAGKAQGATTKYNLYNGCKINSLKISADAPGSTIMFEADIIAQMIDYSTSKTFSVFQSKTVAADPTTITTAVLTWKGNVQINIAAGGLVNVSPIKKFSLTVDNHIEREYGFVTGNDTAIYPVVVALNETDRDILVEMTLPFKDETLVNARIADSVITALTIPIGANTITLSGGHFVADDLPELNEGSMEETVKMEFTGLTIA